MSIFFKSINSPHSSPKFVFTNFPFLTIQLYPRYIVPGILNLNLTLFFWLFEMFPFLGFNDIDNVIIIFLYGLLLLTPQILYPEIFFLIFKFCPLFPFWAWHCLGIESKFCSIGSLENGNSHHLSMVYVELSSDFLCSFISANP